MTKLTPCRAIKLYCKAQCCVGDLKSWHECSIKHCYLYPYRLGKRPKSNDTKKPVDTQKALGSIPSEQKERGSGEEMNP